MIQFRLQGGSGSARGWPAALLIGAGLILILSGLALLAVLGTAAAVIGAGVVAFRRLTGKTLPRTARREDGLELEPDFEILPATPSQGEAAGRTTPRIANPERPPTG